MKNKHENIARGIINTKTDCKGQETKQNKAYKNKHENILQ